MIEHVEKIVNFLSPINPMDELPKSGVLFVFGSINPNVPKYAAELFLRGSYECVLVSGGLSSSGRKPGHFESEADMFLDVMTKIGVQKEKIIIEDRATNTLENVLFGMELLTKKGIHPNFLTITGFPALMRRATATFNRQFPGIKIYSSAFQPIDKDLSDERVVKRLMGEVEKLIKYHDQGDISKVEIPDDVSKSMKKLKKALDN